MLAIVVELPPVSMVSIVFCCVDCCAGRDSTIGSTCRVFLEEVNNAGKIAISQGTEPMLYDVG